MQKLKLNVEELQVETFELGDEAASRGTVEALSVTTPFYATTGGPWFCIDAC